MVKGGGVKGDDGIVGHGAALVEHRIQLPLQVLFSALQVRRKGYVENQVGMAGALDHPEIVDGHPLVGFQEEPGNPVPETVHLRVVGYHRVVMNHQMDVVAAQALPLHIVDQLMAVQGILPHIHLHMEAGEPLTGAVVVDHQIVDAQHLRMGADTQVMVGMDVTVPADMDLTTNCKLTLVPVLMSKDGANNKVLPAIYVYGRTREIVDSRNKNLPEDAFVVLRRENGTAQTINYVARVPYKQWMNGADLKLMGEIHGCADCLKEEDLAQVTPVLLERYRKNCSFYSTTVSRIDQKILEEFIKGGYFERHLNKMRKRYRDKHDYLLELLKPFQKQFKITGENAGLHLLLTGTQGKTEQELIETAREQGVIVYGLSENLVEGVQQAMAPTVILGYGGLEEEQLQAGIEALKKAWL